MPDIVLYEEYRLVELNETAINRAWKGAHLLLFFLAFVFGSFCTFCFHMLMYLFDEKCVLFPKLLSLTSMRHNVIYEFIPSKPDLSDLPVDFLSTQWVEKSTCSLPTYVPLVSGIFGLVWTTLFLMCSTGSRTLTGLQRPWRVLPPVFIFSLAMCGLCVYSSAVTHYGLQELCIKLGEITGSSTCTYTVNVVTLAYERRIRGVYQATRLTIASAWLHTACWFCSALLAIVRILLVVDFQVVKISVRLKADIDKIMERNETQLRSISPENLWVNAEFNTDSNVNLLSRTDSRTNNDITDALSNRSDTLHSYLAKHHLMPTEKIQLVKKSAYKNVSKRNKFIVNIVCDIIDRLCLPDSNLAGAGKSILIKRKTDDIEHGHRTKKIITQDQVIATTNEDEFINLYTNILNRPLMADSSQIAFTAGSSSYDFTRKFKRDKTRKCMKSHLEKDIAQSKTEKKQLEKRVIITHSPDVIRDQSISNVIHNDKETQTKQKEKQD